MNARFRLSLGVGMVLVTVLAGVLFTLPAGAAPGTQDFPTPTAFPTENASYTLETVGGSAETLTFPGAEMDGFTLGETTVVSEYPRGMVFTVNAESETGDIQDVILFVRFPHGSGTRFTAEQDADSGAWVARPWAGGDGQPAWTPVTFYWRVRDTSGAFIDTEPQITDYWDPGREWYRVEGDHVIVYWFGFGEDDLEKVAQDAVNAVESTNPRRVAGFGRELSYKPVAVVYPDRDALAEMYGSGITNDRVAGFTSSEMGMTVQVLRDNSLVPGNEDCVWALKSEDWTMERRIDASTVRVIPHEITHLFQYEILGAPLGPEWWFEGQANWHSLTPGLYDRRLRNLATLQDLPSLTTPIGSDLTMADGCYSLSYDVGTSFHNFLNLNYGGVDTLAEINQLMRANSSVIEAVEQVTGKAFLDVENEWRTYLGFAPLSLAQVDPASALEPALDPLYAEGDTATLPATPPLSPLYEKPGPRQIANGQCFANTPVKVLKVGSLDGVDYYQVDCMGQIGWMGRDQIAGTN